MIFTTAATKRHQKKPGSTFKDIFFFLLIYPTVIPEKTSDVLSYWNKEHSRTLRKAKRDVCLRHSKNNWCVVECFKCNKKKVLNEQWNIYLSGPLYPQKCCTAHLQTIVSFQFNFPNVLVITVLKSAASSVTFKSKSIFFLHHAYSFLLFCFFMSFNLTYAQWSPESLRQNSSISVASQRAPEVHFKVKC